jgi:type IV pilus assembly protein PilB
MSAFSESTVAATAASPAAEPAWRPRPGRLLGDVIVELGFAPREVVESAVTRGRELGRPMGQVLLDSNVVTSDQLARAVADRFSLDHVRLDSFQVDMGATNLIDASVARRLEAVPIGWRPDGSLLVAMVNPSNVLAIDDIAMITDRRVHPAVVSNEDLQGLLTRLNRLDEGLVESEPDLDDHAPEQVDFRDTSADDEVPAVKLVHSVIAQAIDQGASDIHFDPDEGELQVRYRIDGVMSDAARVPRKLAQKVVARVKILADLDIAERRLPQDGRVGLTVDGRRIDLRVAIVPLVGGESAVLRILDSGNAPLSLEDLGMADDDRAKVTKALSRAHGAVLTTGPTGSGKSTSLYAALRIVRSPEKTVMTIEDPVEQRMTGVKQVQVSERTGLTFARGLRSMMRADPDVVMVGEMRDRESAHIAIEAALTGHMVLSTLHTNDAPTAGPRLVDMGIEPYLVASALECVVAQRLARKLCESCRRPGQAPASAFGLEGEAMIDVYEPVGCSRCRGSGYRGRIGLYEVMLVTEEIRSLIVRQASSADVARVAVAQGMRTLREDGLLKAREGLTSLAEVARVTG